MVGFGSKQAWLAVRDGEPAALIGVLGLRDLGEVPWRGGVDLAYLTDDRLVVTPPLRGAGGARWVLAAGRWLLGTAADRVDVASLSADLGTEVQLFATYRVGELHRWQRGAAGRLVRAFGYLGEAGRVTDWHGSPDDAELALGVPPEPDGERDVLVAEADVLRLAAAWSVDPMALDGRPAPGPLRVAAG
jgi:hypothetical protein